MNSAKTLAFCFIALLATVGVGWHIYQRIVDSRPNPAFSFNQEKAEGWTGSANINVQNVARSTNYDGEEPIDRLPLADITVHHVTGQQQADDNCFVMYSYFDRTIESVATAREEYVEKKSREGVMNPVSASEQTLYAFGEQKTYEMQQYQFETPNQDLLQGYQVGFVELPSAHIRIEGVCKTADDLQNTFSMLGSVELLQP